MSSARDLLWMARAKRRYTRALDADQKLNKAEAYGKKAIGLITNLPKPATITEEDFAKATRADSELPDDE